MRLIYQVVRLAEQYGVDVPEYRKIAEAVKKQTENKENVVNPESSEKDSGPLRYRW